METQASYLNNMDTKKHTYSKMSDTEKIRDIMKREEIYSYVLKRLQIDNVTIDTMGTVTPMPDELKKKSFQDFSSVDDEAFDSWVATLPVCLLPPLNGTGGEFISDKDMMAKQLEQQQEKKVVGHPMPYHFPKEIPSSEQTGNQMGLYNLNTTENGEHLSLVDTNAFALEKEIQVLIENNTQQLWNLRFVASEFSVDQFRFDSVCFDDESKSFVIIEYKKDHSFSIIDQGFSYLSTMLQNKSDFILKNNDSLVPPLLEDWEFQSDFIMAYENSVIMRTLKKDDVDWSQSRIIFISPSLSIHQKNSINFKDMPFELWEIQRYSNNMVSFNQYSSSSNESITSLPKGRHVSKGS